MYRISLIIGEIYSKYLPLAERSKISLNLDISDPSIDTENPEQFKHDLEDQLKAALERAPGGEITISLQDNKTLSITDNGTILSKTLCRLLSKGRVTVTSRVGFGTTVRFDLTHKLPTEPEDAKNSEDSPKSKTDQK